MFPDFKKLSEEADKAQQRAEERHVELLAKLDQLIAAVEALGELMLPPNEGNG
jgi:hypothetical protein